MSDDEDLELGHNPDTYEPARLGWHVNLHFNEAGPVFHEPEETCAAFECRTGLWFATTPEAVAAIERIIAREITRARRNHVSTAAQAVWVRRALGFQDAE